MKWLSINVYYPLELEYLVLQFVEELIFSPKLSNYKIFYVKYFDDSHHIRFRLFAEENVHEDLYIFIKNCSRKNPNLKRSKIIKSDYVPEVIRYGGLDTMPLAENFFSVSSKLAIKLLATKAPTTYSQNLIKAILLNYLTIRIFIEDQERKDFLQFYTDLWIPERFYFPLKREDIFEIYRNKVLKDKNQVELLITSVKENKMDFGLSREQIDNFQEELRSIVGKIDCLKREDKVIFPTGLYSAFPPKNPYWALIISFIHMNNNKMCVQTFDEAYLSFLLLNAL